MDADAFRQHAGQIPEGDVRSAIDVLGMGKGDLAGYSPERPLLLGAWQNTSGRLLRGTRDTSAVLSAELDALGAGSGIPDELVICDPWCGFGTIVERAWRECLSLGARRATVWAFGREVDEVVETSLTLLFAGYRGSFGRVRVAGPGEAFLQDVAPDIMVSMLCGVEERELAHAVTDAVYRLPSHAIAVFTGNAFPIGGTGSVSDRRPLLETGRLDAVVERFGGPTDRAALAFSPRAHQADSVLLACMFSDGIDRHPLPSHYMALREAISARESWPFFCEPIPVDEILASRDLSLRYSAYRDTVDVMGRLSSLPSTDTLLERRQELIAQIEELELIAWQLRT